jgi:hypothetical protein
MMALSSMIMLLRCGELTFDMVNNYMRVEGCGTMLTLILSASLLSSSLSSFPNQKSIESLTA